HVGLVACVQRVVDCFLDESQRPVANLMTHLRGELLFGEEIHLATRLKCFAVQPWVGQRRMRHVTSRDLVRSFTSGDAPASAGQSAYMQLGNVLGHSASVRVASTLASRPLAWR